MNAADVREAAAGRWADILPRLDIPGDALTGRHGPCPGCGGRDRFRFDDKDGRGTWICGQGGEPVSGDGFALLHHVKGWDFGRALREVAYVLGMSREQRAPRPAPSLGSRADVEAATVQELNILAMTLGRRVAERQMSRSASFRFQNPEWRPEPHGPWDREVLAARRLLRLLVEVYPEVRRRPTA